jgi:MFS family permease
LTSLPIYFSTILRFNLQQNGVMFAIPYLCQLVFTVIAGQMADRIRAREILSTTATRRWQTIIGAFGTSIFLVLVGYIECNQSLAVIFISLSVAFIGFQASGSLISHLDIASNYAGTLMGITNMLASIPGFVGPMFVGWITNNNVRLN